MLNKILCYIIEKFLLNNNIEFVIINKTSQFNSLSISNHVSELDPFLLFYVFYKNNISYRFVSDIKVKKIPIFGLIAKFMNYIFIDRNNPKEAIDILNKEIKSTDNIFIFPEGTLFYKPMIEKSNDICKKLNIKNFKNVLCPKINGYNCINKIKNSEK